MRITKLFKKLGSLPKRYLAGIAAGLVIAIPLAVNAGYGPNRPTFDWNNPADRQGSTTGPVFNSFINTPSYGDERAFVDAKDSANTAPGGFADTVDVAADKEYTVRAYVHNNANEDTNASGLGVAKNTRVRFKILPGLANGNEVTGYISADNATPTMVYDTVKLKNDTQAFSLEYVPGSARLESNAHPFPGVTLPDTIVSESGALIGDSRNGDVLGCFQYTEIVTIKVRIKTPKLTVAKRVSSVEAPKLTDSVENLTVKKGDTVTWRIDYKNTGNEVANDITIRDQLPAGLTLVPGSITWIDVNHPTGKTLPDTALTSGGVNVGNYAPNGNGVIRFRTKINADIKVCALKNIAYARANDIPEQSDDANLTISDCNKPPTPTYVCDSLSVQNISGRTYRFTAKATVTGGATITQYMFNFGDNQNLNTTNTTVDHTYAKEGSYLAVLKVQVRANGQDVIAEGPACTKPITIHKENCPIPGKGHLPKDSPDCKETVVTTVAKTTTTPTVLPNTGPGSVIGIFTGVSLAGSMAHRFFTGRRYS